MKTYKESEFYRMKISISYTLLHIAILYNTFSWEWVKKAKGLIFLGVRFWIILLLSGKSIRTYKREVWINNLFDDSLWTHICNIFSF